MNFHQPPRAVNEPICLLTALAQLEKNVFFFLYLSKKMLLYLVNEPCLSLSLSLAIKQAILTRNNVFVNKIVSLRLDLSIYDLYLYLYVYKWEFYALCTTFIMNTCIK